MLFMSILSGMVKCSASWKGWPYRNPGVVLKHLGSKIKDQFFVVVEDFRRFIFLLHLQSIEHAERRSFPHVPFASDGATSCRLTSCRGILLFGSTRDFDAGLAWCDVLGVCGRILVCIHEFRRLIQTPFAVIDVDFRISHRTFSDLNLCPCSDLQKESKARGFILTGAICRQ